MTREEAVEVLTRLEISNFRSGKSYITEAFIMAINALRTEPCEDCVSRQAAISEIKKLYVKNPKTQDEYAYNDALDLADEMIHDLPSVSLQDVIRCSDCVHYAKSSGMCERNYNDKVVREMNFYCGFAKREMEEN